MIRIEARCVSLNLAPGEESAPFLVWHGTWTGARVSQHQWSPSESWAELGSMPAPASTAEDAMLHFELVSHTSRSGVPDIDAAEASYVKRHITAGNASVGLHELLARPGEGQALNFIQWMVYNDSRNHALLELANGETQVLATPDAVIGTAKAREIELDTVNLAYKSKFEVRAVGAEIPRGRSSGLHFGTPEFIEAAGRSLGRLEEVYIQRATNIAVPEGMLQHPRFEHDPNEPLIEHLHMHRFETATGPLPAIAMVMQTPVRRRLDEDMRQLYGSDTTALADQAEMMLTASLLRHGLSIEAFTRIVQEQAARQDEQVYATFPVAVAAVGHMGAFLANQINYTADICVPNIGYLSALPEAKQRLYAPHLFSCKDKDGDEKEKEMNHHTLDTHEARAAVRTRQMIKAGWASQLFNLTAVLRHGHPERRHPTHTDARHAPAKHWRAGVDATKDQPQQPFAQRATYSGEMWSFALGSVGVNSGDCEDSAALLYAIQDMMLHFSRTVAEFKARPLLRAMGQVLEWFQGNFLGGAVSDPYVKTDASAAAASAEHKLLPVIGSEADRREWREGGHAFGNMEPVPLMLTRLLRGLEVGGCHPEDAREFRRKIQQRLAQSPPWLLHVSGLVLEGTGMTSGQVGSFEETYRHTIEGPDVAVRKGAAILHFTRALKAKATPEYSALAEVVRVEAQPYELWEPTPTDRRRDRFYRAVGHILSARIYDELGPTLAHMVPVRISTQKRGLAIGPFLDGRDEDVAYVPIYAAHISQREWRHDIEPYLYAQLNQQPLFSLFAAHARVTPQQQAQPLLPSTLVALATGHPFDAPVSLGASMTQSLTTVLRSQCNADCATLALSFHAAKLTGLGVDKTRAFTAALEKLRAQAVLRDYAIERSKPLPLCGETIQVLLALAVPDTVDEKEFPKF